MFLLRNEIALLEFVENLVLENVGITVVFEEMGIFFLQYLLDFFLQGLDHLLFQTGVLQINDNVCKFGHVFSENVL